MKEEKKNGEGKGGKYLEEDDIFFFAEEKENRKGYGFFSGGEEKLQMKRRKVLGEGKYLVHRGKEERRRKIYWRSQVKMRVRQTHTNGIVEIELEFLTQNSR